MNRFPTRTFSISSEETSPDRALPTRDSTPAPDFHDHRHRPGNLSPGTRTPQAMSPVISPGTKLNIPKLEIQSATPSGSISGEDLSALDTALRSGAGKNTIARDFENEHAIDDDSDGNVDEMLANGRRGSARRDTRRGGRPREIVRNDRSRETSSSRSTSPANSIEAFAEPRRRQRANTIDSHGQSVADFQKTRLSLDAGTRRGTLSNISLPQGFGRNSESQTAEVTFDLDEEPGKTYKIDFEELEEFCALCAKGLLSVETTTSSSSSTRDAEKNEKVFKDVRTNANHEFNNAALNPDTFFEKTVVSQGYSQSETRGASGSKVSLERPEKIAPAQAELDRFTFFSSETQNAKYSSHLGGLLSHDETFRDLFDLGAEGGVWWLDVLNPTRAELEVIAKAFKIHRLTREDIETQDSREKVELFSQYYFVCFRSFNPNKASEDFLDPLHIYIVVTADGVLSFSYAKNPHAKNVRRRIAKLGDFVSLGPDYICYAMIDDIVDSFAPIIHAAETESETIEDQVFIAREDDFLGLLRSIGECRKRVLNMMRLLGGKADVIKGFAKRCNEQYEMTPRGDIGLYLGDIQDHVVTMMSNLNHVEKMLGRSHANYLAQLNVDNILKGNSTNKALAKITVVATVIVPLNLVTGLFGMNVHVPGQPNMEGESLAWFGGICGFIVAFVIIAVSIARKLKYI